MSWWLELYDHDLAEVLLVRRDPRETARTVDFLVRALELAPGARVFDQCCGIGSLAIPLVERGMRVTGCDLGRGYVERAARESRAAGVVIDLHQADACTFVAEPPCAAALNWWTSFGYSDDRPAHLAMLRAAFASLAPGGRFALDFMNVPGVLHAFEPRHELRRETPAGDIVLVRESRVDPVRMTMEKTWRFASPDGPSRVVETVVRLYTPRELAGLLAEVGFEDVHLVGDLDGAPLTLESPRCIALARRPLAGGPLARSPA